MMVGTQRVDGSLPPLNSPKSYGITKPLSIAGPSAADTKRNLELEKYLVDEGLYESNEDTMRREEVLGRIDQIVKHWVKQLTQQRGYTDQMVEDANAVIFTFGSYRLGVHGPGADIDTLCVGPSYVNREEDFFITLHDILAEMEEVTELQPVPDAHVPVMKFKFQGIPIDLLYASISLLVVPQDLDISNSTVLCDVDEPTVRSLNGCRVADQILKLVPNFEEIELNKQHWSSLFEQYMFFEAYKNYLQVDIVAADAEDLLAWKGWVESRFRQLTLKRAEGVGGQECQQFDIRGTVDEFRQEVNMYMFWKPGMDVFVSHVRRRQLPPFVFPNGYRRPRPSRHQNQQGGKSGEDGTVSHSSSVVERHAKRKNDNGMMDTRSEKPEKRASLSPQSLDIVSPESSAITTGWTPPVCNLSLPPGEEMEAEILNTESTELTNFGRGECNSGSEQTLEVDSMALAQECSDPAEALGNCVTPDSSHVVACESGQEENLDRDLRSVSISVVNEVKREVKSFSGTRTSGEIADGVQLSRSCRQNRDCEGLGFPATNSDHFVGTEKLYSQSGMPEDLQSTSLVSGMEKAEDRARSESLQKSQIRQIMISLCYSVFFFLFLGAFIAVAG
ncbi:unnamed protein product [Thlaspi arvense]|uniref:polynucleotide adenylyltransferase n=1 Tax=Thlaspi arvense TaxID=13288 RepID=A0AAU9SZD1_THLAR|nr:unnamed protein product [Thlaspi arvense]